MKILLYVDPWIDISDKPEFKLIWFKDFLEKSIVNLHQYAKNSNQPLEIKVLASEILDGKEIKKEFNFIECLTISQNEIKNIFNDFNEYLSLQRSNQNDDKFEKLNQIIIAKLGEFAPDIIILMSSSAGYLKYAYPNSLIFFTESGIFNQPPYPGCLYFDQCATMSESFLLKNKDEIMALKTNGEEQKFLSEIRNFFLGAIDEFNPYKKIIEDLRKNFNHIILLSLQRFDSPLFRTSSEFKDQLEYVEHVFDKVDSNIAIIVTEHKKDKIFGFEPIHNYFKNRYKNFIYLPETNNQNNSSQFLLESIDGVITVSSTVGMQALIHQKPLFVPSKISYLTTFCDEQDLTKIADCLKNSEYKNKDGALYYLVTRYYMVGRYYKDGKWFYNFLSNSLNNFKNKIAFPFYGKIDKDASLLTNICQQKYVKKLDNKSSAKSYKIKNLINKFLK